MFDEFWLPPLEERTLAKVLESGASTSGDKVAVWDDRRSLSYGELLDVATKTAGAYAAIGIGPGDRVLLMLDNHVDFVVAWLGLTFAGAIEIPVNTAFKGTFLDHIVTNSGARTIVAEAHYLPRLDSLVAADQLDRVIVHGDRQPTSGRRRALPWSDIDAAGPPLLRRNGPSDVMGIIYTSGTTGPSKGVLTPEAHAYGYATPFALRAPATSDVSYVALPLFHVGGHLCGVYGALIAGATAFIPENFRTASFWSEVARTGATFATLVGAMVNFLMAQPPSPSDRLTPLSKVALAPISGVTPEFADRFGLEICSGYGSTEASSPLCVPLGAPSVPFGLGWPRPDYEVGVVDADDVPVPLGEIGELVIRGREPWTLMSGYLGDPAKTVSAWRNLWYHSGDAVRQRPEDGQFILVDRLNDAIRRRGENISSYAVEMIVNRHPDVTDSAVVAVPDEQSGQEVLAVVLRRSGSSLTERSLLEFLVDELPHFMVPRYLRFMESDFERSASGKVRKDLLRAAGLASGTWDREAAGIRVTRRS